MQPLEVVGQTHQDPIGGHLDRAAEEERSEAEGRLDDPEHWFDGLLAQLVELFAGGALQPMAHHVSDAGTGRRRDGFRLLFQIGDAAMMRNLVQRGVDRCAGRHAFGGLFDFLHGRFAVKSVVGEHRTHRADLRANRGERGSQFLFIVATLSARGTAWDSLVR